MADNVIDYSRKWYVMAAVAMGIFLATIDGSIVNVALPTLEHELHADFSTVQWVVLAYLLTLTTLLLGIGRLADMIGKKPLYTVGFVVFTIGSVLCGLSPSIEWLIGFRALQAIGSAMILALGPAIITEAFPPSERGRALGLSGSIVSIGIVVGPTLGGLILSAASWHWIFFVNLPIGVAGTWMVLRFLPSFKPKGRQSFDVPGALALFAALLALLLALTLGQTLGFGDTRTLLLFAGAAIFIAAFVTIELRAAQPLIDLRLFRNRLFSVNLITGFVTFVAIAGSTFLVPFYLQNVLRYDTRDIGVLLAVVPVAMGVIAPLSGALSDRFGARPITVTGLAMLLIGYVAVSTLDEATSALGYLLRFLPIGVGMGIFQSPNNSAIMGTAPRERLGIVSGLLAITRTFGQTAGIAVIGAAWATAVTTRAGVSTATAAPPAAQVAALHDTIAGVAVAVAGALALSVWGLITERRMQAAAALTTEPSS